MPEDGAEIGRWPCPDDVGVVLQERVDTVQRAARPVAKDVDTVAFPPDGEAVGARQVGQVGFPAGGQGFADTDREGCAGRRLGHERHFRAGDLFDPMAEVLCREQLGAGGVCRDHHLAERLAVSDKLLRRDAADDEQQAAQGKQQVSFHLHSSNGRSCTHARSVTNKG